MSLCRLAVLAVVVAVGCGSDSSSSGNTVTVQDFAFVPKEITVKVGQSVHWQLSSQMLHNVKTGTNCTEATENGEDMDGDLDPSAVKTFDHTFSKAGDVPYFCEYHCTTNAMMGVVHVTQ
jgi:plastocyanin